MGQLTHHRTGLIADAVRDLAPRAPSRALSHAPDAPQVLAALLDLRGSVQLEERLSRRDGAVPSADERGAPPSLLTRDYVRARLDGIEASLVRRMSRPFEGRIRAPDLAATLFLLDGALASRMPGEVKASARAMARAFRELLLAWLERAQGDVAALRDEIALDLRARGARAARLEALDATLRAATTAGVERVIERLGAAAERTFADTIARALRALPASATAGRAELAPWFDAGGLVHRELARHRAIARGLLAHERAVLEALVASSTDRAARVGA
jgi:hypothetical protein